MDFNFDRRQLPGVRAPFVCVLVLLLILVFLNGSARASGSTAWTDTKIVFSQSTALRVVNSDGTGAGEFFSDALWLENQRGREFSPDWSPDGSKVVFNTALARENDVFIDAEIALTNASGTTLTYLTDNAVDDFHPAWSPDMSKIAFARGRVVSEIYVMNANGSGQTQLTFNGGESDNPDWSPDGSKIVFECDYRICIMNSDGTGQADITPAGLDNAYAPAWSPDGSRIAFSGESATVVEDIFVMNANGSSPVNLTNNASADRQPTWSGDGVKIAFITTRLGDLTIGHMNAADGSGFTPIYSASFSSQLTDPDWQPKVADTPPPAGDPMLYLSSRSAGRAGAVPVRPEDIVVRNLTTGAWAMHFDGSDVGINMPLAAFAFLPDDSILLVFSSNVKLPGPGKITPSDVVRFVPSSLGETTAGTFQWYFDGSDVGLSGSAEAIDAIDVLSGGRLLISTAGRALVPLGGTTKLRAEDEDLLLFTPTTTGANTAGSWGLRLDGSTVSGLAAENVAAAHLDEASGAVYLAVRDKFNVGGISGNGKDILKLSPSGGGYTVTRFWRGPTNGFDLIISGIEMR